VRRWSNEFAKREDVFSETMARIRIFERFTDIANYAYVMRFRYLYFSFMELTCGIHVVSITNSIFFSGAINTRISVAEMWSIFCECLNVLESLRSALESTYLPALKTTHIHT
jgi:hypothetical protein